MCDASNSMDAIGSDELIDAEALFGGKKAKFFHRVSHFSLFLWAVWASQTTPDEEQVATGVVTGFLNAVSSKTMSADVQRPNLVFFSFTLFLENGRSVLRLLRRLQKLQQAVY